MGKKPNEKGKELTKAQAWRLKHKSIVRKIEANKEKRRALTALEKRKEAAEKVQKLPLYVRVQSKENEELENEKLKLMGEQMQNLANKRKQETSAWDSDEDDDYEDQHMVEAKEDNFENEKKNQLSVLDSILATTASKAEKKGKQTGTKQAAVSTKPTKEDIQYSVVVQEDDGEVKVVDKQGEVKLNYLSKLKAKYNVDEPLELKLKRRPTRQEEAAAVEIDGEKKEAPKRRRKGEKFVIQCEYVGIGPRGMTDSLARVVLVNDQGRCFYDEYIKQDFHPVTDYRTETTGLKEQSFQHAVPYKEVRVEVLRVTKGKVLIGYNMLQDLESLKLMLHPARLLRDVSFYNPVKKETTIELQESIEELSVKLLNADLFTAERNKMKMTLVDKANTILQLYKTYEEDYDEFCTGSPLTDFFYLADKRRKLELNMSIAASKKKPKNTQEAMEAEVKMFDKMEDFKEGSKKKDFLLRKQEQIERQKTMKAALDSSIDSLLSEMKKKSKK